MLPWQIKQKMFAYFAYREFLKNIVVRDLTEQA